MILDPRRKRVRSVADQSGGRPFPVDGFAWTADGSRIGFGIFAAFSPPAPLIYTISPNGGQPKPIPGTRSGFRPVFSPDGRKLAFARFRYRRRSGGRDLAMRSAIWIVATEGGRPRQLTPWRDDPLFTPFSFSPAGTMLAAQRRQPGHPFEVVAVRLSDRRRLVVSKGFEPAYSPDGSQIAFVRRWGVSRSRRPVNFGGDLFVAATDGSSVRRPTFSPRRSELEPSWDPSGERLSYAQEPFQRYGRVLADPTGAILEIDADGSCNRRLLFARGVVFRAAAWQPGPGREAGRIEC